MKNYLPVNFGIIGIYLRWSWPQYHKFSSVFDNDKGKYVKMYERFINQLQMYANAIRVLFKGYLPISLLPPSKLPEILGEVKKAIHITNPDYNIVIKRLHLYYDMTLVTFGIDESRNLIIQFPVFVQPYAQQQLIQYKTEKSTSCNCRSE